MSEKKAIKKIVEQVAEEFRCFGAGGNRPRSLVSDVLSERPTSFPLDTSVEEVVERVLTLYREQTTIGIDLAEGKSFTVSQVAHSLNRFLIHNDQTQKALEIANQLEEWSEQHIAGKYQPMVTITWSMIEIDMGDAPIWCSETDSDEDLTFEWCLKRFQDHVELVADLAKAFA